MCQSRKLVSAAFPEAIKRAADFTVSASEPIAPSKDRRLQQDRGFNQGQYVYRNSPGE